MSAPHQSRVHAHLQVSAWVWLLGMRYLTSCVLLKGPFSSVYLGQGEPRLGANPSPRLRREDPPSLPPPVAPQLPPSTRVLFLGGAEKAVRTGGLDWGSSALCSWGSSGSIVSAWEGFWKN